MWIHSVDITQVLLFVAKLSYIKMLSKQIKSKSYFYYEPYNHLDYRVLCVLLLISVV